MTQKTEQEIIDAELSYIAATENKRGSTRAESAYGVLKTYLDEGAFRIFIPEITESIGYCISMLAEEIKNYSNASITEYMFHFKKSVKKECEENGVAYSLTDDQAYRMIKEIVSPE